MRDELSDLDEVICPERFTKIVLAALPAEMYSTIKIEAIQDPDLTLEQIQRMMRRNMIINHSERLPATKKDNKFRKNQVANRRDREKGRESAM